MEAGNTSSSGSIIRRYRTVLVVVVVILLALAVGNVFFSAPRHPTKEQVALNKALTYLAQSFNVTIGLVPEVSGGNVYWLYSDNYLASLALTRYDPTNQSAVSFGRGLYYVMQSYASTLPAGYRINQYTALNSTEASFACSNNYQITWSLNGTISAAGRTGALVMTTANNGDPSCSTTAQNYADLLFLQSVMAHRTGNNASALALFQAGSSDFDGTGIKDRPFTNGSPGEANTYQTYKLALYIYSAICLGQQTKDSNFGALEPLLLSQQDNSTGGFYTGYYSNLQHSSTMENAETTSLAALALELLVTPTSQC